MSTKFQLSAIYAAWLAASLAEAHELTEAAARDHRHTAPHQWHTELPVPELVLPPPPQYQALPPFVNNSAMMAAEHVRAQSERDALFTIAVAQRNARNHALFYLLNRAPAAPGSDSLEPNRASSADNSGTKTAV